MGRLSDDTYRWRQAPLTPARIIVVEDIRKERVIHAAIEEELFYPAARNTINDSELINEAAVAHAAIKIPGATVVSGE